jgi:hypothetical protein
MGSLKGELLVASSLADFIGSIKGELLASITSIRGVSSMASLPASISSIRGCLLYSCFS